MTPEETDAVNGILVVVAFVSGMFGAIVGGVFMILAGGILP